MACAFVGAVSAEFVARFRWVRLLQLLIAALVVLALPLLVFHRGLHHYESGSAVQIQV